jgi:hypothetical protein
VSAGHLFLMESTMKIWIVALSLLLAGSTRAQDCVEYETYLRLHGAVQTWGSARSLLQDGDLLYVASREWGLHTLDIGVPGAPEQLSRLDLGGLVWDMVLNGDHLYLAAGSGGLHVVDVSDPLQPTRIGGWDAWSWTTDLLILQDLLIMADYSNGLFFFDISVPEDPLPFWWQPLEGYALGLDLFESVFQGYRLACVATGPTGVELVNFIQLDLSDMWSLEPDDIEYLLSVDTPGYARDIKVRANRAWICDGPGGLQVLSLADPADPLIVAVAPSADYASRLRFEGNHAFLADGAAGLRIYDISNPLQPAFVSSIDAPGWTYDLVRHQDWIYLANGDFGLRIIDAAELAAPPRLGELVLEGLARDLVLDGTRAYVAAAGLQVVDWADPASPQLLASLDGGDELHAVAFEWPLLATGGQSGWLRLYQAGASDELLLLDSLELGTPIVDLAMLDGTLLAALGEAGLAVVSVAAGEEPALTLNQNLPIVGAQVQALALEPAETGATVVLAAGTGGLRIHPLAGGLLGTESGRLDQAGDFRAVVMRGSQVYAGTQGRKLHAVGIANPAAPQLQHTAPTTGPVRDLLLDGDALIVAQDSSGLQIYDVNQGWSQYYLGSIDTEGVSTGLALGPDWLLVADGAAGVLAYPRQCQTSVAVEERPLPRAASFELLPAVPNPFNPSTRLSWTQQASGPARLSICNLLGQELAVLHDGPASAGRHELRFEAAGLASGLYLVRLEHDGTSQLRPVTLLK